MNTKGGLGLSTIIILLVFMLIAVTAASVIVGNNGNPNESEEEQLNRITQEAVNEIITYIQFKDIIGQYTTIQHQQRISSIALLIRPLVSTNIDITTLTIKISNGQQLRLLSFSGQTAIIHSESLFEHPLWENTSPENFSILVVTDKDNSILDYATIDDQTDTAFLLIKLPDDLALKQDDTLTMTLFPSTGITRTITVTAPLPIHKIVSLLDY